MIKTYAEFKECVHKHYTEMSLIPEEYLNETGKEVKKLYTLIQRDIIFADTAAELLNVIETSPNEYIFLEKKAWQERRLIVSCLKKISQ